MFNEDFKENSEEYAECFDDLMGVEEKEDGQVLDEVRNKKKQSKQGFRSLISRKRVSSWDMDEIFLL